MKKVLFLLMIVALIGCDNNRMKYGQGGVNAVQFVKEKVPELRDDIASIEVIKEDSLLSDIALVFDAVKFSKANVDFWEGTISREDYRNLIDERTHLLQDISSSWQFPMVVNDSLKKLDKFVYQWRKVYTVKVTMKSGVVKEPRVLMDNDGITPRMLESEFMKSLDDYLDKILMAERDLTSVYY